MNKGKDLQADETLIAYWQYPQAFKALNRLLKKHGVKIVFRSNYSRFGDQVAVKIERAT